MIDNDSAKPELIETVSTQAEPGKPPKRERTKRLIVPARDKPIKLDNTTSIIPSIDTLIHDALAIIAGELSRYRAKSQRGVTLDLREARAVQGYMESLVKMSREQREAARADDLGNLSDSELLQLATELTKNKQLPAPQTNEGDDE